MKARHVASEFLKLVFIFAIFAIVGAFLGA